MRSLVERSFKETKNLLNEGRFISRHVDSTVLPFSLLNIPLGEDDGVVLDVKTISIRNVPAPYNASIIEHKKGFLLFFRYDEFYHTCELPFKTQIGCVKLDEGLNQTEEEYKIIRLENEFNEDPRAVHVNNDLYLSYNSVKPNRPKDSSARIMKLSRLDANTLEVEHEIDLDLGKQEIEKNWSPFCSDSDGQDKLFFKYYLIPNQNLRLEDFSQGTLNELSLPNKTMTEVTTLQPNLWWPPEWGEPRGGTPALKIGDEYLAFFHSSFRCIDNPFCYIMGAYTFEASPPFRITAISHYPIFFKGIFSSPSLNTASPNLRCVFPSGFVIKKKEGKDLIYLSIGENDSCVKVLTLDKEALLKSLKKISF